MEISKRDRGFKKYIQLKLYLSTVFFIEHSMENIMQMGGCEVSFVTFFALSNA